MRLFSFVGWRYGDNVKIQVRINPHFVSSVTCEHLDAKDDQKQEWCVLMADGAAYRVSVGRELSFAQFCEELESCQ